MPKYQNKPHSINKLEFISCPSTTTPPLPPATDTEVSLHPNHDQPTHTEATTDLDQDDPDAPRTKVTWIKNTAACGYTSYRLAQGPVKIYDK